MKLSTLLQLNFNQASKPLTSLAVLVPLLFSSVVVVSSVYSVADAKPKWKSNGNGPAVQAPQANRGNQGQQGNVDRDDFIDWNNRSDRYSRNTVSRVLGDILLGNGLNYGIRADRLRYQQQLPPGIAKKVAQGRPLPPGIAKQIYTLPYGSYNALGIPNGYRAGVLGDTLIVATAAGIVVDVLDNIL